MTFFTITYPNQLTKTEIQDKTTAICTRSHAHVRYFKIRHLANYLTSQKIKNKSVVARNNNKLYPPCTPPNQLFYYPRYIQWNSESVSNDANPSAVHNARQLLQAPWWFSNVLANLYHPLGNFGPSLRQSRFAHNITSTRVPCSRDSKPYISRFWDKNIQYEIKRLWIHGLNCPNITENLVFRVLPEASIMRSMGRFPG